MGSRVLVYRGTDDPATSIPVAVMRTSNFQLGDPSGYPWPRGTESGELFHALWRAFDEAYGRDWSREPRPDGRREPNDPIFDGLSEVARFHRWASRLCDALVHRGLKGVPQGYWVRPAPLVARWKFRHGAIVPHLAPRRGPANHWNR